MILNWLHKVKPPKYLRYLFFIAYSFYRRFTSERSDAHLTAITFIAFMNTIMYVSLLMWGAKIYDKIYVFAIMVFVIIQFYVWFWYKKKWKLFLDEFKHIKRKQQLLGGVYLFIYLVICLMFFFLPILLDVFFDIKIVPKLK